MYVYIHTSLRKEDMCSNIRRTNERRKERGSFWVWREGIRFPVDKTNTQRYWSIADCEMNGPSPTHTRIYTHTIQVASPDVSPLSPTWRTKRTASTAKSLHRVDQWGATERRSYTTCPSCLLTLLSLDGEDEGKEGKKKERRNNGEILRERPVMRRTWWAVVQQASPAWQSYSLPSSNSTHITQSEICGHITTMIPLTDWKLLETIRRPRHWFLRIRKTRIHPSVQVTCLFF